MNQTECSECGCAVTLQAQVIQGEILSCADCGVELEVTVVEPLTLALAPMEMEDWGE